MLHLLASVPEDGWGFVRDGDEVVLVRPPYDRWARSVVREEAVEKALRAHGFRAERKSFRDWASLIAHLREQIVVSRRERGEREPDPHAIRELVHYASKSLLSSLLDRIGAELLPNREWQAALSLVTELLKVEKVRADPELFRRALDLLGTSQKLLAEAERERQTLLDPAEELTRVFPLVVRSFGAVQVQKYKSEISRRHQTFALFRG